MKICQPLKSARSLILSAMSQPGEEVSDCLDEDVIDLLTDLRHFCQHHQVDFDNCNGILSPRPLSL